ncbi:phosphoribosylglycinamide synthetase [Xenorhabdus beddingii]|uniref:Phosphoribosylglycinamide synthetase n=1 Tax=Xenorhabdus beddingii TaxID=40578 RepID=A0A1Y2SAS7_9GAMM|nr:ATP-grasp domain-containing protein [Xenorhabdus beddingii]OTA15306.1 phosphoribosylglycinamide synthetase [Xenorhabdus beddingii]
MKRRNILIVDPFSTGSFYAPILSKQGFDCYSICSSEHITAYYLNSYTGDGFINKKMLSPEDAVSNFNKDSIFSIISGSETGIAVSDKLSKEFGVYGNDPDTSFLRRDKYFMQKKLKEENLSYINTEVISRYNYDISHLPDYNGYVIKPCNSAGTDGVIFCKSKLDLKENIKNILWGERNITGELNDNYLIQEFIFGDEYVVDMISDKGKTYVSSLCKYSKGKYNGFNFVYESLEILDPSDSRFDFIISYSLQCANALGFYFGPIHMELILSNKGPVMIEAGARLHGGIAPLIFEKCYENDLLNTAISLYSGLNLSNKHSKKIKHGKIVFLINENDKAIIINKDELFSQFNKVESFSLGKILYKEGEYLPLTKDLLTCPGIICLINDNLNDLIHDEAIIREIFNNKTARIV